MTRILAYFILTAFAWFDSGTALLTQNPGSAASKCPPLVSQFDPSAILFIEKYDGNMWTTMDLNSPELLSWQSTGTSYWVGCTTGSMILQFCQQSYQTEGVAIWYPPDNCTKQANTSSITSAGGIFQSSSSPPTRVMVTCPALVNHMSLTGVTSVTKYENNEWQQKSLEDIQVPQVLSTRYWIYCTNGNSFYLHCSNGSSDSPGGQKSIATAAWYPKGENCQTITTTNIPPQEEHGGLKCSPLSNQTLSSLDNVAAVKEYRMNNWRDVYADDDEGLYNWRKIGSLYWVGCSNGASFTQLCQEDYGRSTAFWTPTTNCRAEIPPPKSPSPSELTCSSLRSQFDLSGAAFITKYTVLGWEVVATDSEDLQTDQPINTFFYIGCYSGHSFLQQCEYNEDDNMAVWSSESNACSAATDITAVAMCPPLSTHISFDNVVSIKLASYDQQSGKMQLSFVDSIEFSKFQNVGLQFVIMCRTGTAFTQQCEHHQENGKTTAEWNLRQFCPPPAANGTTISAAAKWSMQSCPPLRTQLSAGGVKSISKYRPSTAGWMTTWFDAAEMSLPQIAKTMFWINCDSGTAFMQTCQAGPNGFAYWVPKGGCGGQDAMATATTTPKILSTTRPNNYSLTFLSATISTTTTTTTTTTKTTTTTSTVQTQPAITRVRAISTTTAKSINTGPALIVPTVKQATASTSTSTQQTKISNVNVKSITIPGKDTIGTNYDYKIISQMKTKRVKIAVPTVSNSKQTVVTMKVNYLARRRRQGGVTVVQDLFELTPQKWNNPDPNSDVYKAVKQTFIEQLVAIYRQAGVPISPNDIDIINLEPVNREIVLNYTATVATITRMQVNGNQQLFEPATIKSSIDAALNQMKSKGAFNNSFGNDGVTLDILDFALVAKKPSPPSSAFSNSAAVLPLIINSSLFSLLFTSKL